MQHAEVADVIPVCFSCVSIFPYWLRRVVDCRFALGYSGVEALVCARGTYPSSNGFPSSG